MNTAQRQALRGQRIYYVSDERLRAFAQLTPAQRLAWVEQSAYFIRMGQAALAQKTKEPQPPTPP